MWTPDRIQVAHELLHVFMWGYVTVSVTLGLVVALHSIIFDRRRS
jgi:hypothetical protein